VSRERRIAVAAYRCLYPDAVELSGGVTVMRTEAARESPMLNRILGLGVAEPAGEESVDAALSAIGSDVTCYVGVEADAEPDALAAWLQERGLEPGWGWMWFRRGVDALPVRATPLQLVPVTDAETAAAFGGLVAAGYGLPDAVVPLVTRAPAVGWDCWLALDGDEPAGAAGIFLDEGIGYLGFAATLPEHRGKGAQSALFARRIDHARERGCDLVVTETGELRDGLPSSSYRNILRAGFEEVAVRANWLRRAQNG
jgi:GNAT superfamily N-acetyltransferase